ncbi:MAG: hypothetical protein IJE51_01415 [Clostridia bacterium]|nr:hypothetical protein [Clostridia bacterium]
MMYLISGILFGLIPVLFVMPKVSRFFAVRSIPYSDLEIMYKRIVLLFVRCTQY